MMGVLFTMDEWNGYIVIMADEFVGCLGNLFVG